MNKRGLDNKNGYWGPTEDDQGYDRWDHPHSKRTNSANSGITLSVGNVRGGRKSSETKPGNMNVVFIMKVC